MSRPERGGARDRGSRGAAASGIRPLSVLLVLLEVVVSAALVLGVVGRLLMRRIAGWRRRDRRARVLAADATTVTLRRDDLTTVPGSFTLSAQGRETVVGPILVEHDDAVTRRLVRGARPQRGEAAWSSDGFLEPGELGAFDEITIETPCGPAPAWVFAGDPGSAGAGSAEASAEAGIPGDPATWVIHVHGVRSDRRNALWGVPAVAAAGMTSLVVSYRGDGEGPAWGHATLGAHEWEDVDAALAEAVRRGAERVVLLGWSMGATASLRVAERSAHRDRIAGLVLVCPALDWRGILRSASAKLPVPGWIQRAALWWTVTSLRDPILSRVVSGVRAPVDLDDLRPVAPRVPTLVLHSRADQNVPFTQAELLRDLHPDLVTLHESPATAHGWEPNCDPDGFDAAITEWLRAL